MWSNACFSNNSLANWYSSNLWFAAQMSATAHLTRSEQHIPLLGIWCMVLTSLISLVAIFCRHFSSQGERCVDCKVGRAAELAHFRLFLIRAYTAADPEADSAWNINPLSLHSFLKGRGVGRLLHCTVSFVYVFCNGILSSHALWKEHLKILSSFFKGSTIDFSSR